MAAKGDSESFVSSPLDGQGARHKDSYYPMSDENAAELRDTDAEFRRLKALVAHRGGLHTTDVGEVCHGVIHQEALRRSDVSLNDVRPICRSSR